MHAGVRPPARQVRWIATLAEESHVALLRAASYETTLDSPARISRRLSSSPRPTSGAEMLAERYTELDSRLVSSTETVLCEGNFLGPGLSASVMHQSRFPRTRKPVMTRDGEKTKGKPLWSLAISNPDDLRGGDEWTREESVKFYLAPVKKFNKRTRC